jgi:hypothetical protein
MLLLIPLGPKPWVGLKVYENWGRRNLASAWAVRTLPSFAAPICGQARQGRNALAAAHETRVLREDCLRAHNPLPPRYPTTLPIVLIVLIVLLVAVEVTLRWPPR